MLVTAPPVHRARACAKSNSRRKLANGLPNFYRDHYTAKKVSHFASQITKIADACLKLTQSNFFRHHALAPRICRHGYAVPFGNADQADRLPGCLYMCAVSYGAAPLAAGVGPIILIRTDGHEVWPQFLTCVSTFVYVSSSPATAAWPSTWLGRHDIVP